MPTAGFDPLGRSCHRIVQHFRVSAASAAAWSRRKQRLPFGGRCLITRRMSAETHVQHAVGFVENEIFNAGELRYGERK